MSSINSSINFDRRLYRHDILASIIHAEMLMNSQIIGKEGSIGSDRINNTWAVPYFGSVAKQNMNAGINVFNILIK